MVVPIEFYDTSISRLLVTNVCAHVCFETITYYASQPGLQLTMKPSCAETHGDHPASAF